MSGTSSPLFSEFDAVTDAEWHERILKDLKGKDFDSTLLWNTTEGIVVPPYQREGNRQPDSNLPGEAPYRRGIKTENNHWYVRQEIADTTAKSANEQALKALNAGATSIAFTHSVDGPDIPTLTKDILPEYAPVDFVTDARAESVLAAWTSIWGGKDEKIAGCLGYDPIAHLTKNGTWYESESSDLTRAGKLVEAMEHLNSPFQVLEVNALPVHQAGASLLQELGSALAHGNAYLGALHDLGHDPGQVANQLRFSFGVGSSYFMEMAKMRAFRQLWDRLAQAYSPKQTLRGAVIHTVTSPWNQSAYDAYTNLLRATTETMSAAMGGANTITVLPHTSAYTSPDGFAQRIARNVQLVLKEESYLDRIIDPAAGSYYVEYLTDQLAQKAWQFFQAIEGKGGYLTVLQSGWLQTEIGEVAETKRKAIEAGETTLLGINKHPNKEERLSGKVKEIRTHANASDALLKPFRGAEAIEHDRLANE